MIVCWTSGRAGRGGCAEDVERVMEVENVACPPHGLVVERCAGEFAYPQSSQCVARSLREYRLRVAGGRRKGAQQRITE